MIRSVLPPFLETAVRRLVRTPRLTAAAIACIALGTAATSAALTLISATLLQPLPYPEAHRLTRIWLDEPDGESRIAVSYPDLLDLRRSLLEPGDGGEIDALEATARARMLVRSGDGARRVEAEAVTSGYFRLLGVEPIVGRLFTQDEHRPGGEPVVLLDHRTWGERFGYDQQVVGKTIHTDAGEHTVVGVLPESFTGTVEEDSGDIELWVPIEQYLSAERRERRDVGGIWTLARLAPGATIDSAGEEVGALGRRLAELHPESHAGRTLTVESLGENWRSGVRRGTLLLLAASGLLLLVAAANVAILLLARALGDRREMAIRAALGAGRRRMLRQTLVETLLLVGAGSLVGLWLGPALLRAVLDQGSLVDGSLLGIPVFVELRIDPVAGGLSCLVFLATALIAGLGPALLGARTDPGRTLREGTRGAAGSRSARRWSTALIVAEVALTTVLVVGATLLLRSYHAMQTEDLGFRTDGVLRMALFVHEDDVPDEAGLAPFYERVRGELTAAAGVDDVAVVWPTVPIDWPIQESLTAPGLEPGDRERSDAGVRVGMYVADGAFFDVLGIPLLAGRGFRETDGPGTAPVAVVNRSLAVRLSGGDGATAPAGAVGTEVTLRGGPVRIVGVVGDARYGGPREADNPASRFEVYLPFRQSPQRLMSLLIDAGRSGADPETLVPPLTRRLAGLAPASALDWIGPLDRWVTDLYIVDTRFLLSLVSLFSLAGLLVSAIGLFAVLADSVARRRPEIGIRQALGATPGRILASVVARGLRVVVVGLLLGALLAWSAGRLLESFVYGVTPTDPWTYAAAATVLLAAAVASSLLPARSAAAVDPAEVLREE